MLIDPTSFRLTKRPAFIAFEGINGCGKTTLQQGLHELLEARGKQVVSTREPGGTALGTELRKILLSWTGPTKSTMAELLLFAADRAEHIDKAILPALTSGKWVLCDRYIFSTIAFQGHGRGINRAWINSANELATQGLLPDLVVLIDLEPAVALKRALNRTPQGRDSFEEEELAFHQRIRGGFLQCGSETSAPVLVLDGSHTPPELLSSVVTVLGIE